MLTAFVDEHVCAAHPDLGASAGTHRHPSPFVVAWLRRALGQGTPARGRRVYVAGGGTRRVVNEDRVVEFLRRHGFEVIHPDRMALVDQIRVFEEAEAVVAPTGRATNIVSPSASRSSSSRHRHTSTRATASSGGPPATMPIDALAASIRGMLDA